MTDSNDQERTPPLSNYARSRIRIPKTAEVIAASIRRKITSGELTEGSRLESEGQVMADYAVSRPTVREAFRILESEKLISVSQGARGGARVHIPRSEQVARYAGFVLQAEKATYRDVYEARTLIEPPAARRVAERRSKDAPAILRELVAAQRRTEQGAEFGRAVLNFHTRLLELTDNKTLILVFGMLDGIVARFQAEVSRSRHAATPGSRPSAEAGLRSQEKLIGLIEAGDGPAAEAHWRMHMENSGKVWLAGGPGDDVVDWMD